MWCWRAAPIHQEHRASSARVNDLGALLEFAPRADIVVSLTESMSRWLAGRLGGAAPELLVIPNPLPAQPQPRSPLHQRQFHLAMEVPALPRSLHRHHAARRITLLDVRMSANTNPPEQAMTNDQSVA